MAQEATEAMKVIALTLSLASLAALVLTMAAGLQEAHGGLLLMSHLHWGFLTLVLFLLTVTFCLMFIFKMHRIIHQLITQLEQKS